MCLDSIVLGDWREGYPKGTYTTNGNIPKTNPNAAVSNDLFNLTVPGTLKFHSKKISFIHMDCDLYSSTKYALIESRPYLDEGCIIVFGAFLNYAGYDGDNGALRAFYEFVRRYEVEFEGADSSDGAKHRIYYLCKASFM